MSDINVPPDYNANPSQMPRPYVQFFLRATERRDEFGNSTFTDEPWVKITAQGGKDVVEKIATEWLENMKSHAHAGRIPIEWPGQYAEALKHWLIGEEIPLHGTAIKTWTALSPGQREAILQAKLLTVEDLAQANDEALTRIGMGGIGLREMARKWVAEASGPGAMARELAAIKISLEALTAQNHQLLSDNAALRAALDAKAQIAPDQSAPARPARTVLGAPIALPEET